MSLYVRLCGRNDSGVADEDIDKILIDQFRALLIEKTYGGVSREDMISLIGMTPVEEVQLDDILAKGSNPAERRELAARIGGVLHLSEGNVVGYGLPSQLEAAIAAL